MAVGHILQFEDVLAYELGVFVQAKFVNFNPKLFEFLVDLPAIVAEKIRGCRAGDALGNPHERSFFLRVEPNRLDHALVFAHFDLQFLGRTQLLEASKACEGVSVVTGVVGLMKFPPSSPWG